MVQQNHLFQDILWYLQTSLIKVCEKYLVAFLARKCLPAAVILLGTWLMTVTPFTATAAAYASWSLLTMIMWFQIILMMVMDTAFHLSAV